MLICGPGMAEDEIVPEKEIPVTDPETVATNMVAETTTTNTIAATNLVSDIVTDLQGLRDPFWPVGYEPAPPEPEVTDEEMELARFREEVEDKIEWPEVQLKGITRTGKDYMAIIEGIGLVETSQVVSMRRGDMLYSWFVEEVNEKGVLFTRLEARPYRPFEIGEDTE